jgi:hypothetical protein
MQLDGSLWSQVCTGEVLPQCQFVKWYVKQSFEKEGKSSGEYGYARPARPIGGRSDHKVVNLLDMLLRRVLDWLLQIEHAVQEVWQCVQRLPVGSFDESSP